LGVCVASWLWAELTSGSLRDAPVLACPSWRMSPRRSGARPLLVEDALRELFGFNYESVYRNDDPDLERIILAGFLLTP
jgi:hypothetical protein